MDASEYVDLAERYGCPFYVYDEEVIAAQLAVLRKTFPAFRILYSVKTNPHPAICRFMAANGVGADGASSHEVRHALKAGFAPENIFYSAPGKTVKELTDALGACVVTADSCSELARLNEAAATTGLGSPDSPLPVGIRINPDIAFGPGEFPEVTGGVSSKFGVDEESLRDRGPFFASLRNIRPAGLHVFLRSQVLGHASLAASFAAVFALAVRCRETFGWELSFLNFGGGLGIPSPGAPGLDADALREEVADLVAAHAPSLPGCALLLESGRFLVGRAGTFVTRIEDIKESRGKTYVIAPGGLNGFLRPAVMNLLSCLPHPAQGPFEPLFSNDAAHPVALPGKTGAMRRVTVCGNLCTALDVIARDVLLPDPQIGDMLTIANAGAYAATLSPSRFASFPEPMELYREADGTIGG